MATLIPPDGLARTIAPVNGRTFTAPELHALVGGYFEALRTSDGQWVFLNEDGKREPLPYNPLATQLMRDRIAADDYIVGNVVLCSPLEAGEGVDDDEPEADGE